jgi:hypothetical protein
MDVRDFTSIGSFLFVIYRYFYPKNIAKYDLSFIKEKEINYNSKDYLPFSKLKFSYDKNHSLDNITLFSFSIRNTGNVDITAEMLRQEIVIQLPENYTVIKSKLDKTSNNSKPKLNVQSNKLSVTWDLMKPEEHVKINSLIFQKSPTPNEENKIDSIINSITIEQRISGINGIGKFLSTEIETLEKTKSFYKIEAFINLFIGVIFFLQIPIISHWVFDFFSDYSEMAFEWSTLEFVGTFIFVLFSIIHILAAILAFDKAKKFR